MSDTESKCYISFVFEWTDAVNATNAFEDSQFGPALGVATGNLLHMNDIMEEALREIAHGTCDAEDLAQDAIDKIDAHIVEQMNLHPRRRKVAAGKENSQPDTQEAIARTRP